ncbi:MAG TPA: TrkH family potassium uptake protein [Vicinamibacterales bacterium]|nr:TrkH family potassium uptake protein [Vicinamibacterales bacterium]
MRLPIVLHLIGIILRLFGLMFLGPFAVAWYHAELRDALAFGISGLAAAVLGHIMIRSSAGGGDDLRRVEGLAVVAATWLLVAHAAAAPYVLVGMSPVDALFESMSGLTTTGATVIRDFSQFGRGVFFWRSMTQWLGGMGVIALFVAVLPRLSIGGRQLFFAEAPGPTDEKLTPQIRKTAAALWAVYAALTAAEIVALALVGMPLFDATCNAFTTLAAGGFSPHPLSIMGYGNPAAEWIITFFMLAAGANFALHYRLFRGEGRVFVRDEEFRAYLGIVIVSTALLVWLLGSGSGALWDRVRVAVFQVTSILTTTGYASVDFQLWSDQAKMVLFILMFIGGCAGSASGGPKVVRQVLIARYTLLELRRTIHPRGVLPVKLGGRVVPDDVMRGVLVFFLFYLLVFAVCAFVVVALGADLVTGITAAIATLGNTGPGFGAVGPMSHFGDLHPVSKIVLTAAMWIGRLEVLTVLALLRPEVWRTTRWSS